MTRLGQEVSGNGEVKMKEKKCRPTDDACAAEPSGRTDVLHPERREHWKCHFTVATGKLWEADGCGNFTLFCTLDGFEPRRDSL